MLRIEQLRSRPYVVWARRVGLLVTSIVLVIISLGGKSSSVGKNQNKPQVFNSYRFLDVNQISCTINSDGTFADSRKTNSSGLEWPKGTGKTAVYTAGLWLTGIHHPSGGIRTALMHGESEYQPGPLLETFNTTTNDGSLANSRASDPRYRLYKVQRTFPLGDTATQTDSWQQWPGDLGAPYIDKNGNGKWDPGVDEPKFYGDEQIWCVVNDVDTALHGAVGYTLPMGVEVRCLYYAFDAQGPLGNTLFLRWEIINKSDADYDSLFASIWSDVDLGSGNDDLPGCDTALSLGYVYNGSNTDGFLMESFAYGVDPPADGFVILAGPGVPGTVSDSAYWGDSWVTGFRSLPMTASTAPSKSMMPIIWDPFGPGAGWKARNIQQGLTDSGSFLISPTSGQHMIKWFSGDPVTGTGDLPANFPLAPIPPQDIRIQASSGPFTLAKGDTQHFVGAYVISRGTDYLNSITRLKNDVAYINSAFYQGIPIASIAQLAPYVPLDSQVTLTGIARATYGTVSVTRWSLLSWPAGSVATIQDSLSPTASITPDVPGTYSIRFIVEIPSGLRDTAETSFQALTNRPPAVIFSAPQQVVLGDTIHIDASAIHDPDGDPLTIHWTIDGGSYTPLSGLSYADSSMGRLVDSNATHLTYVPFRTSRLTFKVDVRDAYYTVDSVKSVVVNPITSTGLQLHSKYATAGFPIQGAYQIGRIKEFDSQIWFFAYGALFTPNFNDNANPAEAFAVSGGDYWVSGNRICIADASSADVLTTDSYRTVVALNKVTPPILSTVSDVYYSAPYLFFSRGFRGLYAYDVTNPAAPTMVSQIIDGQNWGDLVVDGSLLYCLNPVANKVKIVDISVPSSMLVRNTILLGPGYTQVRMSGDYLYVVKPDTVSVFNVTDPSNFAPAASIPVPRTYLPKSQFYDVCPYGNYLLAGTQEGSYIYDVTNHAAPSIYAKYLTGYPHVSTFVNARRLIAAQWDLLNPGTPERLEGFLEFDSPIVGVNDAASAVPVTYALEQNYPNPFNPATVVEYSVPQAGFVSIRICNLLGQVVAELVSRVQVAGWHRVEWKPSHLSSGMYFITMQSGSFRATRKALLLR